MSKELELVVACPSADGNERYCGQKCLFCCYYRGITINNTSGKFAVVCNYEDSQNNDDD